MGNPDATNTDELELGIDISRINNMALSEDELFDFSCDYFSEIFDADLINIFLRKGLSLQVRANQLCLLLDSVNFGEDPLGYMLFLETILDQISTFEHLSAEEKFVFGTAIELKVDWLRVIANQLSVNKSASKVVN